MQSEHEVRELARIGSFQRFPIEIHTVVALGRNELGKVEHEIRKVAATGCATKCDLAVGAADADEHFSPRRVRVGDQIGHSRRRDSVSRAVQCAVNVG